MTSATFPKARRPRKRLTLLGRETLRRITGGEIAAIAAISNLDDPFIRRTR
jgi:hypothetical protein